MALPPFPQTEFQRLAPAEKIQTGRVTLAFLGTTRVAITRTSDGQVRVFKNVCPHAGSPLSGGCIEHDEIACPRHGWLFDLRSGNCVTTPGYELRFLESRVHEGWVEARRTQEVW